MSVSDQYSVSAAYVPVTVQVTLPSLSPEEEAKKQEVMREQDRINELLKANRTFWEEKLSSQLLLLLESDSYKETGKISEQDMDLMQTYYSVIPSDQVTEKMGIKTPTSDLFLVEISVDKSASVHIVDPYVAGVSGIIDNQIYCWIELTKLQDIASLDDVIQIHLVSKPVVLSDNKEAPITNLSVVEKKSESSDGNSTPVLSLIEMPVSLSSGTASVSNDEINSSLHSTGARTTPASSVSTPESSVTITASLMIILLCMRWKKNR